MVNEMPKPYRYSIINNGVTTVLTTDPSGWEDESIGFTRSEDYGLDKKYTIPLSFAREGYKLLKTIFSVAGMYATAQLKIESRMNDWSYANFYIYRLDFKTYKDNGYSISIEGLEDGLLGKFSANADTEYEIPLPTAKQFLDFTGVSIYKKNIIQCGYGKLKGGSDLPEDVFVLLGNRSTRTYSSTLSFVDAEGVPFDTMTFKALQNVTFDMNLIIDCIFVSVGTLGVPDPGELRLIKHDAFFGNAVTLYTYANSSTKSSWFKRTDTFSPQTHALSITLAAGEHVSLAYYSNGGFLSSPECVSGNNTFMEISALSESAYVNAQIEVFTHKWLIGQLLLKIDSESVLVYNVEHLNFMPFLTCTSAIRNIGKTVYDGTVKTTLKKVLNSLDVLSCVGLDFNGNVLTVSERASLYSHTEAQKLKSNNIIVAFDESKVHNTVEVGWDTNDTYDNDVYPFNCKKVFSIKDSTVDNKLDLVHPFMGDMYQIEEYIASVLGTTSTSDATSKLMVLACIPFNPDAALPNVSLSSAASRTFTAVGSGLTNTTVQGDTSVTGNAVAIQFNTVGENITLPNYTIAYAVPETCLYELHLNIACTNANPNYSGVMWSSSVSVNGVAPTYSEILKDVVGLGVHLYSREIVAHIILQKDDIVLIKLGVVLTAGTYTVNTFTFTMTPVSFVNKLYRNQTLTGFKGDAATVYNLPVSPKRLLQKHSAYLGISNWKNPVAPIPFLSSDKESALISRLGYETEDVIENADFTCQEAMFLPLTVSFDADVKKDVLMNFDANRYRLYSVEDERTGKVYKGWCNAITFSIGKNQSKSWELQAYDL